MIAPGARLSSVERQVLQSVVRRAGHRGVPEELEREISAASGGILTAEFYAYRGPTHDERPFDWYLAHLWEGGREHGLPAEYLERLRAASSRNEASASAPRFRR